MSSIVPLTTRRSPRESRLREALRATSNAIQLAFQDGDLVAVAELRTQREAIEARLRRIEDRRGAVVGHAVRLSEGAGVLLEFVAARKRQMGEPVR